MVAVTDIFRNSEFNKFIQIQGWRVFKRLIFFKAHFLHEKCVAFLLYVNVGSKASATGKQSTDTVLRTLIATTFVYDVERTYRVFGKKIL